MKRGKKLKVGILFGGRSSEHEISLRSAQAVISAMDPQQYVVIPIGITRDGKWYLREDAEAFLKTAAPKLHSLNRSGTLISLPPYPNGHHLTAVESKRTPRKTAVKRKTAVTNVPIEAPDVVFPMLHGSYGEDGTIQGLLELAGIPYVGAGVLGSAVGMDKDVQKRLLRDAGLPVVKFFSLTETEAKGDPRLARRLADQLGYPVFIKPSALGSSIGVSRVVNHKGLDDALAEAFQYDRKVLLEASCSGREFECAVLGNDRPEASLPGEVILNHGYDFYSYESKYLDAEGSAVKIPADLPSEIRDRIRAISIAAFSTLGLRGMARVDFLAPPNLGDIFINEVNTIPGFTAISMYPKMWEATGLPLPRLIDRLIELALEEHDARSRLKYNYTPRL